MESREKNLVGKRINCHALLIQRTIDLKSQQTYEEFDPGSERTLVACLMHASRASRGQP